MVNPQPPDIGVVFAALADPTRREIVRRLASGDAVVKDLGPFGISHVAVWKHVRVLERAGLVSLRRVGRHSVCRLTGQKSLRRAGTWLADLDAFWQSRLDSLSDYLSHPYTPE